MLNSISHGKKSKGPPLVVLHGLFGSANNWNSIARAMSDQRHVICVDLRNHGNSPWHSTHSYDDLATDVAMTIDEPADIIGHSMGGKAAMVLALRYPQLVNKLIVADISPIRYNKSQTSIINALLAINLNIAESRTEVISQMLTIEPDLRAFLAQSINLKEKVWRINLKTLKKDMNKIVGFPNFKTEFIGKTLFITGEKSNYTHESHKPNIRRLFPNSSFISIQNAGHWLHVEKPLEFKDITKKFLNEK